MILTYVAIKQVLISCLKYNVMSKIITEPARIEEVLKRGVEKIYPNHKHLAELLGTGKRISVYCGFDPSAPSLHIGNAILLNKLAQFQALGHEVVFLIGDFTGMIGDPTDKATVRKKLTRTEVLSNAKNFQKQASAYLAFSGSNPALVRYNSRWQDQLNFADLIELSSHFTVQQMIQRDMFQGRLKQEKPIYFHEFLYPLAQAYDSVALDVDLEIGGNDQMFNMMAGRDLMKSLGKKDKSVMTLKLLTDAEGQKMGKTTGNAVFLDTDANNMYGVIMSWPDEVIAPAFELCSKESWEQVKKIAKDLSGQKINPRDAKMSLALAITSLVHGAKEAEAAQKHFQSTIQNKEVPTEMLELKLKSGWTILEALASGLPDKSKGELRRLATQGGVSCDGQKINDLTVAAQPGIYKVGKRQWLKLKK